MKSRFYSFLSILGFAVLYAHTAIIVLILFPLAYFRFKIVLKSVLHFWAKSVFWILGKKIKITGKENYSKDKHYIIIANHSSLFDIMAIMSIYPDVAWFGHGRLMKVPVFRDILKMTNYIPLRETSIRNTKIMLDEIIQKAKQNTIAIFPEGTRTLNGKMNNFYRGFIYILKATDADILPVTLNGFYNLKPKNRSYINFDAKLSMIIGQPINTTDLKAKSSQEIAASMKSIIESNIINHPDEQE